MNWELVFTFANRFAMLCWLILAFAPARDRVLPWLFYLGCGLLALTYAVLAISLVGGWVDIGIPEGTQFPDLFTLTGVMALFDARGGATIGWIHYLAFDLFIGIWMARNADIRAIPRWVQVFPLFFILMAGPLGLVIYLVIRQFLGQKPDDAVVPH